MLTYWLIRHLDPQWMLAHKMWSIRFALIQAVLMGLWVGFPAFQDFLPPARFLVICVALSVAMVVARLLCDQAGEPHV